MRAHFFLAISDEGGGDVKSEQAVTPVLSSHVPQHTPGHVVFASAHRKKAQPNTSPTTPIAHPGRLSSPGAASSPAGPPRCASRRARARSRRWPEGSPLFGGFAVAYSINTTNEKQQSSRKREGEMRQRGGRTWTARWNLGTGGGRCGFRSWPAGRPVRLETTSV